MKIGCDACGQVEAAVLCCADEAALCCRCDAAVHSANKLAGKHRRVALLPSGSGLSQPCSSSPDVGDRHPVCDICQEKTGYFFCLEDRALLCRSCDVAVHTASPYVSTHRRFLITGVRIGGGKDHIPDSDVSGTTGAVVSSTSSSDNGSTNLPGSSNLISPDNRLSSSAAELGGGEGDIGRQQQWSWSDIFADGVGMEQCYPGL